MIEERAVVHAVRDGSVWVRALGPDNCPRCAAGAGCGGGILSRMVRRRPVDIAAASQVNGLAPGDAVIVGLEESALVSASVRVYLIPLLAMLALGGLAHLVLEAPEPLVVLAGALGLGSGFWWLRRGAGRGELSTRYKPVILRKDPSAGGLCARVP